MTGSGELHKATLTAGGKTKKLAAAQAASRPAVLQRRDFFVFGGGTGPNTKKDRELQWGEGHERKFGDSLARHEQPAGRKALFYSLKSKHKK
jgi:hypothetical protein